MTERVLITGISGFTGRYLAGVLGQRGLEVHGLARATDAGAEHDLPVEVHICDLLAPVEVQALLADVHPEYVVHLAGVSFAAHDDLQELYLNNILGTRNLLQGLTQAPAIPRHVIVASSANVYGNQAGDTLHEDLPLLPANDYGVSKAAVEHLSRIFLPRLPITVVRPFNYTGAGQSASFLVPKIVAHFRRREAAIELGNTQVARDFSDVRDVSAIYSRLLGNTLALGETLNICSGKAVSLGQVIDTCARISGHRLEVRINPAFVRANEVRVLAGSPARLNSIVGAFSRIPLEETLRWMLEG